MKDHKREIADLSAQLEDVKAFAEFAQTKGWKVFEGIMRAGVGLRVKQILRMDCKPIDAHRIRGEVDLLEYLLRAPTVLERDRRHWENRIKGLQDHQSALEYRGLDDHESPLPPTGSDDGQQEA